MSADSRVTVVVNGKEYPMVCKPGEEARVNALGKQLDAAARKINHTSGPMAEARLLVMAALVVADTLAGDNPRALMEDEADTDAIAEKIESAAARIESLASDG